MVIRECGSVTLYMWQQQLGSIAWSCAVLVFKFSCVNSWHLFPSIPSLISVSIIITYHVCYNSGNNIMHYICTVAMMC